MHPGSHTGAGVEKGLARVVKNLDHAINLAKVPDDDRKNLAVLRKLIKVHRGLVG